LARDLEHAEAEEGIDAFAEAEILERGGDIGRQRIERVFLHVDTVALDHHADEIGVARLLETLQCDRFLQHRIFDGLGELLDDQTGAQLGVQHLLPKWHCAQTAERGLVELGPRQFVGFVVLVRRLEMLTEEIAMRGTAELDGLRLAHESPRETHEPRHDLRPPQALIVAGEPALVLGKAETHEFAGGDVDADRLTAGDGEVVVGVRRPAQATGDADALPDQERPHREHLEREPRPAPPRHVAFVPGDPVDEEQDVPPLLLHHRLEGVDQRRREVTRALGQLEQAKGEEAVDAFAVAGDHEGPFGIARFDVNRFLGELDAVGAHHVGEHVLVPPFFEAIERDRFLEELVAHRVAVGRDAKLRLAFGLHGDVPDRQRHQPIARVGIELRPVDDRRLIGIEGVEQHPAEQRLVLIAAQAESLRSACLALPHARRPIGVRDR